MTKLVHAFWHRSPDEMSGYRPGRHAYLWTQFMGDYTVRTWTNRDGRPIATGWFKEDASHTVRSDVSQSKIGD